MLPAVISRVAAVSDPMPKTLTKAAAAALMKLASNGYAGANHTHLTELLREREGIDLSRPTVRRILAQAGIGSPRTRRSPQHRFRRRRMPQEGMLVQIDGSHHPWLEDREPRFVLLLAVDNATGACSGWSRATSSAGSLPGCPLTEGTSGNIIGILNRLQRALAAGEPIKTAAYQWLAQTRNEAKRWPSDAEVVDKVSNKPHEMTPTWRDMVLHAIEDRLRIDQGLAPTDRKLRTVTLIPPGEAGTTNYPIQESRPTPSRQQRLEDALKQLGNLTIINGPMRKREQEARLE